MPASAVDPKADALLKKMSTDLARTKSFTCDTSYVTEVVTTDGQKVGLVGKSSLAVQRPNMLRTDRKSKDADLAFFYDGKNISVFGKRMNMYATAAAPPTIDKMIDFARDQLDIEAPAADLLYADPYALLMEDVVSGKYIGEEPVGDRTCHHLAYRGNETDWQIWIEDGATALPCRFEITSKKVKGEPEFSVEISNWKLDPSLPPDTFVFTPPKGATRISFLAERSQNRGVK